MRPRLDKRLSTAWRRCGGVLSTHDGKLDVERKAASKDLTEKIRERRVAKGEIGPLAKIQELNCLRHHLGAPAVCRRADAGEKDHRTARGKHRRRCGSARVRPLRELIGACSKAGRDRDRRSRSPRPRVHSSVVRGATRRRRWDEERLLCERRYKGIKLGSSRIRLATQACGTRASEDQGATPRICSRRSDQTPLRKRRKAVRMAVAEQPREGNGNEPSV